MPQNRMVVSAKQRSDVLASHESYRTNMHVTHQTFSEYTKTVVDCGVFTCMFANMLSSGRELGEFGMENIDECRKHIAYLLKCFMPDGNALT